MADKLVLLDSGEQALNNPPAGGILIAPTAFKMGDSDLYPESTQVSDIVGNFIVGGQISYVEVLSAKVCRFALTVDTRTLSETVVVKEVLVQLEGNISLARAVFDTPYTIEPNEPLRLSVILATSRADLTTINCSVGEHESIPSTPTLYRLPPPGNSEFNAISVLNGMRHPDNTNGPVIAMRYGAGSFQWGFTNHMRAFSGIPASATTTSFKLADSSSYTNNEQVIVHVVAGSGEGMTRRYRYNLAAKEFRDVDSQAIPNLPSCTIAVHRAVGTTFGGGSTTIPSTENIPPDWVLTPGTNGELTWQPPKAASRIISTLFTAPSRLDVAALNYVGAGDESRYSTGNLVPENANYVYPALGLATQHRTAFELSASEIEFAENIDSMIPIDLRIFTKSPSTGTRVVWKNFEFVGDGANVEYELGIDITSTSHVFAFISSTLQPVTSYSWDAPTKTLRMVSPVESGLPIEFRVMTYVEETGYSTRMVSRIYNTTGDTFYLKLPTKPQNIENLFISQSGAHVHQENYSLIDDTVVFSSSLEPDVEVEVIIFENIQSQGTEQTGLNGIVIDGYVTNKNIVLLRHGALPVELPIPAPKIAVSTGLQIDTSSGAALISIDESSFPSTPKFQRWSIDETQKGVSTLIATQRVELTKPIILMVSCDFSVKLGPGYATAEGSENIEYVVGIRSSSSQEPAFGRNIRGTGTAGLIVTSNKLAAIAYANATMTQMFELDPENHNTGYVEIVAKMRVNNANTSQFETLLNINLNALEVPKS